MFFFLHTVESREFFFSSLYPCCDEIKKRLFCHSVYCLFWDLFSGCCLALTIATASVLTAPAVGCYFASWRAIGTAVVFILVCSFISRARARTWLTSIELIINLLTACQNDEKPLLDLRFATHIHTHYTYTYKYILSLTTNLPTIECIGQKRCATTNRILRGNHTIKWAKLTYTLYL